jgi:hypothetical protein
VSSSPSLTCNQYGELSTKRKARWRSRLWFPDAARHQDHLVCSETTVSTLIMRRTLTQHMIVNVQFYSQMQIPKVPSTRLRVHWSNVFGVDDTGTAIFL